ncbi:MAG: hypothetical protein SOR41_03630 [Eubacteriales bacterium]|nr:hypothetical protein [Eubacteriaceae bacterium]MDY3037400.1 hypothetical protein [Eubacteriales bacterium]
MANCNCNTGNTGFNITCENCEFREPWHRGGRCGSVVPSCGCGGGTGTGNGGRGGRGCGCGGMTSTTSGTAWTSDTCGTSNTCGGCGGGCGCGR